MPRPALPPNAKLRKDGRIEVRVQVGGRRVSRYARTPEEAWRIYAELEVERSRSRIRRSGGVAVVPMQAGRTRKHGYPRDTGAKRVRGEGERFESLADRHGGREGYEET